MHVISYSRRIYAAFLLFLCSAFFSASSLALPRSGVISSYGPELERGFYVDGNLKYYIPSTNQYLGNSVFSDGFSTLGDLIDSTEQSLLFRLNSASFLSQQFDSCLSSSGFQENPYSGYKFAEYSFIWPPDLIVYAYCNVVGGSEPYSFPVRIETSYLACSPDAVSPSSCLPLLCADGLPEDLLGYYKCDRPPLKQCENGAIILKSSFCPISETGEFPSDTESPVLCRDFYSCLDYAKNSFQCSANDIFNFDYMDPLNWSVYCEAEPRWPDNLGCGTKYCFNGESGTDERSSYAIVDAIERQTSVFLDAFSGSNNIPSDDYDFDSLPSFSGLISDAVIDFSSWDSGIHSSDVCPLPIELNIAVVNRTVQVKFDLICDFLLYIRPLILAAAYLFAALLLIRSAGR